MHRSILFIIAVALGFFTTSCKKENCFDCVKTTGKIETTTRSVAAFTRVTVEDKIDVILRQGADIEVKVEAGEHLQKLIRTTVSNGELTIKNDNKCNWVRGYKHKIIVYVTAPYYDFITNNGVGNITASDPITQNRINCATSSSGDIHMNVNCQSIFSSAQGDGDLYFTGITNELQHDYTGTNFLYAKDLAVTGYVYLHSTSVGHAYINAPNNGLMDIKLDSYGNVYYNGNPNTIHLTRDSKGELIKE